jgi:hypothetical protein
MGLPELSLCKTSSYSSTFVVDLFLFITLDEATVYWVLPLFNPEKLSLKGDLDAIGAGALVVNDPFIFSILLTLIEFPFFIMIGCCFMFLFGVKVPYFAAFFILVED